MSLASGARGLPERLSPGLVGFVERLSLRPVGLAERLPLRPASLAERVVSRPPPVEVGLSIRVPEGLTGVGHGPSGLAKRLLDLPPDLRAQTP